MDGEQASRRRQQCKRTVEIDSNSVLGRLKKNFDRSKTLNVVRNF
jgi:hypothetical protein